MNGQPKSWAEEEARRLFPLIESRHYREAWERGANAALEKAAQDAEEEARNTRLYRYRGAQVEYQRGRADGLDEAARRGRALKSKP